MNANNNDVTYFDSFRVEYIPNEIYLDLFGSISAFASLVRIPIGITRSAIGLQIYAITAGSKKYKSKRKEAHKTVLLTEPKLNRIEALTSKALINSVISHGKYVLMNNVLKEYNEMDKEIKNSKK